MQTVLRVGHPQKAAIAQPGADAGALVAGFLGLTFFLGYEWLMSGISKLAAGDFAAGLSGTLSHLTENQSGWYKALVDGIFVPNAQLFAYLVMVGELALGIAFIVAAVVLLSWRSRLAPKQHVVLLGAVAGSAIVGAFMSLNFHLAVGASAPWLITSDPYDQGVDLDSLMVVMQVVLAAANVRYIVATRRARG